MALCRRLGYAVAFDPIRPGGLHYRLRMCKADEHQVAWRLHRMSLTTKSECFQARGAATRLAHGRTQRPSCVPTRTACQSLMANP